MFDNNKEYKFDALGFGITTFDYICVVDRMADYRRHSTISELRYLGGGCISTALVTIQRLGGKASLVTALGNDWIGKEILEELSKEDVDYSGTRIIDGAISTFSFIQVSKKLGKRAISFFPGSSSCLEFSDKAKEIILKSKTLILDGIHPFEDLKAASFARENGVKVMLDCNLLIKGTNELLPHIDYLITSEPFLYAYSKSKNIKDSLKHLYSEYAPEVLVTTLGKRGSIALVDGKFLESGIFDVKVIDTTGCGDVYHGAFLLGLTKNWDIKDIMSFSTAVSSIKCMQYGGRPGIPDFNTTIEFLKTKGFDTGKFR